MSSQEPINLLPAGSPLALAKVLPARGSRVVGFLLQLSHRAATVAMILTVVVWGMLYLSQDFHLALAAAFGCANLGLCAALVARWLAGRRGLWRASEAVGAAVVNGVILGLSMQLMLISRLDILRATGNAFFSP